MWFATKVIFNALLFVLTGYQGVQALHHGTDAGWTAGFVFCSTGCILFGEHGLLSQLVEPPEGSTNKR